MPRQAPASARSRAGSAHAGLRLMTGRARSVVQAWLARNALRLLAASLACAALWHLVSGLRGCFGGEPPVLVTVPVARWENSSDFQRGLRAGFALALKRVRRNFLEHAGDRIDFAALEHYALRVEAGEVPPPAPAAGAVLPRPGGGPAPMPVALARPPRPVDDGARGRPAARAQPPGAPGASDMRAYNSPMPDAAVERRRGQVLAALKHSWDGYWRSCAGRDELKPVSKECADDVVWLDKGLSIVDALDTLWIAGMRTEFDQARAWVAANLTFDVDRTVSFFESTIRIVGGLLSAYELSKDTMFLEVRWAATSMRPPARSSSAQKAEELAVRLSGVFTSETGIPYAGVNLRTCVAAVECARAAPNACAAQASHQDAPVVQPQLAPLRDRLRTAGVHLLSAPPAHASGGARGAAGQ
jgi:hypothetical protein